MQIIEQKKSHNITSFYSTPFYHHIFDSPYQNKLYSGMSVRGVAFRMV